MAVGFLGLGSCVPKKVISNKRISEWASVAEEWISERTGIYERRYAEPGVATSELATRAAREALNNAAMPRDDIKAVIVATSTPDQPLPATASAVQAQLGVSGVAAFDLNAACVGFLYGLVVAEGMIDSQDRSDLALVVGADLYSRIMNRTDRRTVSLFGDGAGAAVLGPVPDGYGIRSWRFVAHGEYADYVGVLAGGTRCPSVSAPSEADEHLLFMSGQDVRKYALDTLPAVIEKALEDAKLGIDDIGRAIFHQANTRLVHELSDSIGLSEDRVSLTAPFFGNTAAASIPLTMHVDHHRMPFARGEHLLLAAVGAGMTAGAVVVTWY